MRAVLSNSLRHRPATRLQLCHATSGTQQVTLGNHRYQVFNAAEAEFLYEEIYVDLCYIKPDLIHVASGATVIDIGANVGLFALQAADAVGPSGTVIAVEASPRTFQALQHNVTSTAVPSSQRRACIPLVYNFAVSHTDTGHASFTFYPNAAGWGTLYSADQEDRMVEGLVNFISSAIEDSDSQVARKPLAAVGRALKRINGGLFSLVATLYARQKLQGKQVFEVPRCTVHGLIAQHRLQTVDLLKIDVEGAELEVLRGMEDDDWRRVRQTVIEVHSSNLLRQVEEIVEPWFDKVIVRQDRHMVESGLYLLYAVKNG